MNGHRSHRQKVTQKKKERSHAKRQVHISWDRCALHASAMVEYCAQTHLRNPYLLIKPSSPHQMKAAISSFCSKVNGWASAKLHTCFLLKPCSRTHTQARRAWDRKLVSIETLINIITNVFVKNGLALRAVFSNTHARLTPSEQSDLSRLVLA